jgi:predicted SAM-dependent methyltransferase
MTVSMREIASRTLSLLKSPLGRWHLRRELSRAGEPLRIELGAWTTRRPGWVPTDVHWRCRNYLDATSTWPIAANSVAYIFSDNVIEHLDMTANRTLFREALRVLRPGGRIRIVTPDVGVLVKTYLSGPEAADPLLDELRVEGYRVFHQVDVLRFAFQDDGHHIGYLWDTASLTAELQGAGFVSVVSCPIGDSGDPDLQGLELRVDTPVARMMLVIEAVKPTHD